jgi:hypothetical protein
VWLAGLLATGREVAEGRHVATLEDEAGLVEAALAPGEPAPRGPGPWLADGTVEDRHGVAVLTGARLEQARPGMTLLDANTDEAANRAAGASANGTAKGGAWR